MSTNRCIDAKNSKWGSAETFGGLFESMWNHLLYEKFPSNGGTHKYIISDPRLESITTTKESKLVYGGTISTDGKVSYNDKLPFATNPVRPLNTNVWPESEIGVIVFKNGEPIATVYTPAYMSKKALWRMHRV